MEPQTVNVPLPLLVPGYLDSPPPHWQADWLARLPGAMRADLGDWSAPRCDVWVARLDAAIRSAGGPVVLVSHSLGGLAVTAWAARHAAGSTVTGAMLVAMPDPTAPGFPPAITGFGEPTARLPFPSVLVASRDDPYAGFAWSEAVASRLGSRVIDVGAKGHINPDAGFGPWPEGEALLADFVATLAR